MHKLLAKGSFIAETLDKFSAYPKVAATQLALLATLLST